MCVYICVCASARVIIHNSFKAKKRAVERKKLFFLAAEFLFFFSFFFSLDLLSHNLTNRTDKIFLSFVDKISLTNITTNIKVYSFSLLLSNESRATMRRRR